MYKHDEKYELNFDGANYAVGRDVIRGKDSRVLSRLRECEGIEEKILDSVKKLSTIRKNNYGFGISFNYDFGDSNKGHNLRTVKRNPRVSRKHLY